MAFGGSVEKLFERGNGNFLAQVGLMAKYDPLMSGV